MTGQTNQLQAQLEEITRPGVDGTAVREVGRRADPFEVVAMVDVNDIAAADAKADALQALQGTICGFTDAYGVNQGNVIVIRAQRVDIKKLVAASGGLSVSKGALVIFRFVLQKFD